MFVRQKHKITLSNLKKKKDLTGKKNTCKNMLNKELSFNNFCGEKYFSSLIFFSLEKKKLENNY